jgi:hypothetical protein
MSMNLGLQHTFRLPWGDFVANISTHYESGSWRNFDHGLLGGPLTSGTHVGCDPSTAAGTAVCEEGLHQQPYWRNDFTLTYDPPSGNWSLEGYVKNFTNVAVYEAGVYSGVNDSDISAPRTFGFIATYHIDGATF